MAKLTMKHSGTFSKTSQNRSCQDSTTLTPIYNLSQYVVPVVNALKRKEGRKKNQIKNEMAQEPHLLLSS